VALIYALTGTLNMADLALRVPLVTGPDAAVLQAAALLLLVVFGFKAALLPLSMWLPATYAAASAPVAALFAIMTKVGVYASAGARRGVRRRPRRRLGAAGRAVLLPLALATSVLGVLGALAAHTLPRLVAWLTVASVGTDPGALGLFGAGGLVGGAVLHGAQHAGDRRAVPAGRAGGGAARRCRRPARAGLAPVAQPTLLGLMLLLAAASAAGLPPLPGFIGKLMLLQARGHALAGMVWSVVLLVGLLTLLGLARAGSILFWSVRPERMPGGPAGASPRWWRHRGPAGGQRAMSALPRRCSATPMRPPRNWSTACLRRGRAGRAGVRDQVPRGPTAPRRDRDPPCTPP
jgi:multicomponent K+:H+ antiporter subunit D